MYRTGDPRFRRRLDEIGQTLENANIQAQSGLYDFQQNYLKPCLASVTSCLTTCIEASCPTLNLTPNQRERLRRQQRQGRGRGREEVNFDFYDDWDEEDNDALMGWGNDEFDRLLAGGAGYGTVAHTAAQPGRQRGMSYPKARRKSAVDGGQDPTAIPGSSLFGKLFGGKLLHYKPSAADLQDHPGARTAEHDITEGEALLREGGEGRRRRHQRMRSETTTSGHTTDSLSSRGDIFPSDEEDDAIPLDDEFAMVLERRTTMSGPETESSSGRTRRSTAERPGGKRPSAGSRHSTMSSRRRTDSSAAQSPVEERMPDAGGLGLNEMKEEEEAVAQEEEEEVERRRQAAQQLAAARGLAVDLSSKEATPEGQTPVSEAVELAEDPSVLNSPLMSPKLKDEEDDGHEHVEASEPRTEDHDTLETPAAS